MGKKDKVEDAFPRTHGNPEKERKLHLAEGRKIRENLLAKAEKFKRFFPFVDKYLKKSAYQKKEGQTSEITIQKAKKIESELLTYYENSMQKARALVRTEQIEWPEPARLAVYDESADQFSVACPGGRTVIGTSHQIEASMLWGSRYRFDRRTSTAAQLTIFLGQIIMNLNSGLDQISSLLESTNWFNLGGSKLGASFTELYEAETDDPSEWKYGYLCEKMAASLFVVYADRLKSVGLHPESVPVQFNVFQKVDFAIADNQNRVYGIQFVSTTDPEKIREKEKQLRAVAAEQAAPSVKKMFTFEKIFLVAVEMARINVRDMYKRWRVNQDQLVGGPEQFLPAGIQREIFMKCLIPIISLEKATTICDAIWPGSREDDML